MEMWYFPIVALYSIGCVLILLGLVGFLVLSYGMDCWWYLTIFLQCFYNISTFQIWNGLLMISHSIDLMSSVQLPFKCGNPLKPEQHICCCLHVAEKQMTGKRWRNMEMMIGTPDRTGNESTKTMTMKKTMITLTRKTTKTSTMTMKIWQWWLGLLIELAKHWHFWTNQSRRKNSWAEFMIPSNSHRFRD